MCFIGCGGVVPALAFHLASRHVRAIRILNRTESKAQELCAQLRENDPALVCEAAALADPEKVRSFLCASDLAVQCTSLGLRETDPPPVDPALLPAQGLLLYDTIYKPTAFLKAGAERGLPSVGGLTMLLYQGAASFAIWTGAEAPLEAMRRALLSAVKPSGTA